MSKEHLVAIVSFEGALKRESKRIRKELSKVETLSEFKIDIEISGRVHDGDVKLEYALSRSAYGSGKVTGDNIQAVLDEFLRRNGWEAVHAPKAIGYEKVTSDDSDEIPF